MSTSRTRKDTNLTTISTHLRSNVVGYVAVFLALSASAAALPGKATVQSNDLKANAVKAKHIKDGQVRAAEVSEASLDSVPDADRLQGTSLADVLAGDALTTTTFCEPGATPINCASRPLTLPRRGDVLVIGTAHFRTDGGGAGGVCRVAADGVALAGGINVDRAGPEQDSVTVFGLKANESAGTHTYSLQCFETEANLQVPASAVVPLLVD